MKRLGIYISTPPSEYGGGAERVMMRIAAGIAERGHDVDFVVSRANSPVWASLSPDVRLVNLNTHRYAVLPGLLKYIRRERPDTLLSTGKSANLATLTVKRFFAPDMRLVLHQSNSLTGEFAIYGAKQKLAIRMLRLMMPSADSIVTLNKDMAIDIKRAVPSASDKVRVIYDPHDLEDIRAKSSSPLKHTWLAHDRPTPAIVTVARLHFKKDIPTLLRAFAVVADMRPARLVIVGDGPALPNLLKLSEELGISKMVDFVGFKDNPYAYMARADVFALSSLVEGLVGVLIEAMACGTSVVSTDCTFGPSEILQDGRLGRLSPVGDHKALAESIVHTLDNPTSREELLAGASRFSAEAIINEYEKLLREDFAR